jgi:hypothetical protein
MLEKPIHYHVDFISRGNKSPDRRHVVFAAEYRAGEPLNEKRRGTLYDKHKDRTDVIYKEILLPFNAPREYLDRETLWNAVDAAETLLNKTRAASARTAIDIDFFLSNDPEMGIKPQIAIAREHVIDNFVNRGYCVDMCVHDAGDDKPHVHLLISTRPITSDGTFDSMKDRALIDRKNVPAWRKDWAERLSYEFERRGLETRFFADSYKKRGIDREPTRFVHRGVHKSNLRTERVLENEAKKERNRVKELGRELECYREPDRGRNMERDYE